MIKKFYDSAKDFESAINPDKVVESNEGKLYYKDGFVYKIFWSITDVYYKNEARIRRLGKLDDNIFTVPVELIYIGGVFCGFKMINAGVSLSEMMLKDDLTFEEKKSIGYQLKYISEYLKSVSLVHPDINIGNILYLDNIVRLTDVNGILKLSDFPKRVVWKKSVGPIRMPEIYEYWMSLFGAENLVYLEINFCMHVLFNVPKEVLLEIYKMTKNPVHFQYVNRFVNYENTAFDEDVSAYFNECFNQDRKELTLNTYLIDHLK